MRQRAFFPAAALAVLLSAAACGAEPIVRLPATVHAKPGRLVKLTAETDCKQVRWFVCGDADLIPSESGKWAIFSAPAVGSYRVVAFTAAGDVPSEPAVCAVVVEGPTPPEPPTPPTPPPDDPFVSALQAAYGADVDQGKADHKKNLASLYRQGAITAQKPTVETWGKLFEVMMVVARDVGLAGKLQAVQGVIQTELKKSLPTDPAKVLDADGRALAAKVFGKVAASLEAVR